MANVEEVVKIGENAIDLNKSGGSNGNISFVNNQCSWVLKSVVKMQRSLPQFNQSFTEITCGKEDLSKQAQFVDHPVMLNVR